MKIASYNIQDGGAGREQLIIQLVKQIDADVLFLQEVVYTPLLEDISRKHQMFFYMAKGNSKRNIAILSKYPLSFLNSFHPFPLKHTLLEARITKGTEEISLFGIHLAPYPFFFFEIWRLAEISIILSRIKAIRTKDTILCGDFNSVAPDDRISLADFPKWMQVILILAQAGKIPRWVIKKLEKAGLIDCHKELEHNDPGYTLPACDPHIRLDYFFVSYPLQDKLIKFQTIVQPELVKTSSDHLPIQIEIDL